MRLIDGDVLKEMKFSGGMHDDNYIVYVPFREVVENIDKAPTVDRWISVKDRLPEEHESIFYKLLDTPKWSSSMWKQESDKVIVYVSFPDGTGVVTTGCLHDSDWTTTVSKVLPQTVTHWMPLPEPPKE